MDMQTASQVLDADITILVEVKLQPNMMVVMIHVLHDVMEREPRRTGSSGNGMIACLGWSGQKSSEQESCQNDPDCKFHISSFCIIKWLAQPLLLYIDKYTL
jgi:hypothetical protein